MSSVIGQVLAGTRIIALRVAYFKLYILGTGQARKSTFLSFALVALV